ncbi:MAG: VWA domain-containing protein [Polyangiaceae bacterium]|nr:VWA domain-containing protein [Polyangiaceae bacterium]
MTAGASGAAGSPNACEGLDTSRDSVLYLSPDDAQSMASPVILRRRIEAHEDWRLHRGIVRPYEFLNYYDLGYERAAPGTVALSAEATAAEPGQLALTLAVSSPASPAERRPMNLTFVLDTSGSMLGAPISLLRQSVLKIASQLRVGDRVSMVTWDTSQLVLLEQHAVMGPEDPAVVAAVESVNAVGGTDLSAGLARGYALASAIFDAEHLNRVILISDGQANAGITDAEVIGAGAALNDGDGIYLVGVGVGEGVNDTLMDEVTDAGRGAYVYLDTSREVDHIFGERFDEVMDVAARAVQIELTVPWYLRMQSFFGEEFSTNPRVVEPQHLGPDDAVVLHQTLAACAAEHLDGADPVSLVARWSTPVLHAPRSVSLTTTVGALTQAPAPHQPKVRAILAYAIGLATASAPELARAIELADSIDPDRLDRDLVEVRRLAELARRDLTP